MEDKIKRANLKCKKCGFELLVKDDKVWCQHCKVQVKPSFVKNLIQK